MKKLARLFKAFSDETRLRIFALLCQGEMCVCDLVAVLELPQSTVSRHLAYLRNNELVEDRRQGLWMYYRLAEPAADAVAGDLRQLLQSHLLQQPQTERDRLALEKFRSTKTVKNCI